MKGAAFVFEAAPEKLPLKQQIFAELKASPRRHDPRQQQLGDSLDRDRRESEASRARGRDAFLESAASRAAGRGDPERVDQRGDRAEDHRSAARRRPPAGACEEGHPGLCRQPAAARLEARGDRAGGGRRMRCRDHRQGGENRLRRAHGGARADGAVRPGRPRSHARHPERADGRSRPLDRADAVPQGQGRAGKLGMRTGEGLRKWTPESADAVRERLRGISPSRRRRGERTLHRCNFKRESPRRRGHQCWERCSLSYRQPRLLSTMPRCAAAS